MSSTTLKYDYLVYAVGAETQTFNIPGVKEHACFMKELDDAEKVRTSIFSSVRRMLKGSSRRILASWIVSYMSI